MGFKVKITPYSAAMEQGKPTFSPGNDNYSDEAILLHDLGKRGSVPTGNAVAIKGVTTAETSTDLHASECKRQCRRKACRVLFFTLFFLLFVFSIGLLNVFVNFSKFERISENATMTSAAVSFEEDGTITANSAVHTVYSLPKSLQLFVTGGSCSVDMVVHQSPIDAIFRNEDEEDEEDEEDYHRHHHHHDDDHDDDDDDDDDDDGNRMRFGKLSISDLGQIAAYPDQNMDINLEFSDTNPEAIMMLRNMYSKNDTSDVELIVSCSANIVIISGYVVPLPWRVRFEPVALPASPYLLTQAQREEDLAANQKLVTTQLSVNGLLPSFSNDSTTASTEIMEFSFPVPATLQTLTVSIPDTVMVFWEAIDFDAPVAVDSMGFPVPPAGTPNVLAVGVPRTTLSIIRRGVTADALELDVYAVRTTMPDNAFPASYFIREALGDDDDDEVLVFSDAGDGSYDGGALSTVGTWLSTFVASDTDGAYGRSCGSEASILFYVLGLFRVERTSAKVNLFDNLAPRLQGILYETNPYAPMAEEEEEEEVESWDGEPHRRSTLVDDVAPTTLISLNIFDALTDVQEATAEISGQFQSVDDDFMLDVNVVLSDRDGPVFDLDVGFNYTDDASQIDIALDFVNTGLTSILPEEFDSVWTIGWSEPAENTFAVDVNGEGTSVIDSITHDFTLEVTLTATEDNFTIVGDVEDVTVSRTLTHDIAAFVEWGTDEMDRNYANVDHMYVRENPSTYLFNIDWDHAYAYSDDDDNVVVSALFEENGDWFGTSVVTVDLMTNDGLNLTATLESDNLPDVLVNIEASGDSPMVGDGLIVQVDTMRASIGSVTIIEITEWNEFSVVTTEGPDATTISFDFAAVSDMIGNMSIDLDMSIVDPAIEMTLDMDWSVMDPVLLEMAAVVYSGNNTNLDAHFDDLPTIGQDDDTTRVRFSQLDINYGGVQFVESTGDIGLVFGDYVYILLSFDGDVQESSVVSASPWTMTASFSIGAPNTDFEVRCNYIRAGRNGVYTSGSYMHVPFAYLRLPSDTNTISGAMELYNSYFYDMEGETTISFEDTEAGFEVMIPTMYLRQVHGTEYRNMIRFHNGLIQIFDEPTAWDVDILVEMTGWDLSQTGYLYMRHSGSLEDSPTATLEAIGDPSLTQRVNDSAVIFGARLGASSTAEDVCNCIALGMTSGTCTPAGFPVIGNSCNAGQTSVLLRSLWADVASISSDHSSIIQNSLAFYLTDSDFIAISKSSNSGTVAAPSFIVLALVAIATALFALLSPSQ